MLIVRHLKSLSVNFLGHVENSAAWLMQVSMFRAFTRFMTGACRSYGRTRDEGDGGEPLGPLVLYDRNACQWKTVARMIHVMREAGFLSASHRGEEWLTNLFCAPPKRMAIRRDQDNILSITEKGKLTAKLHASVLFPDLFGALNESERTQHFGGKKFKHWTKARAVLTPGKSMSKAGGTEFLGHAEHFTDVTRVHEHISIRKRPRSREAFMKTVQECRRKLSKLKDALHAEERLALSTGNHLYLKEVLARWDALHESRYLISPYADSFLNQDGHVGHGVKSRFLKYSSADNREVLYPMNDLVPTEKDGNTLRNVSRNRLDTCMPFYATVQIDVMNALHYREDSGQRGTSLENVVTGKMKAILWLWITGPRAQPLQQLHLHIDDPVQVLVQK
ncbi:hypothetical protein BWQ96_09092 [Gracilariopsis chorda]|uniref:Uncharacterized protein n=1 Tax=Gracilariopsis chorda TaxID=448386 RepID=A0A2V3IGN4_9FLOR|nr:hypothetical protein BWQ96_09092 [Gracilariopsis chorda]|eukprot:PXF41198.1 hypothetical protein BWQ96_09092 [Gracilariopsis chorda]